MSKLYWFYDQESPILFLKTFYLFTISILILGFSALNLQGKVDSNRQIRPILSDKCYKCHGPDAKNQKSDFRIDSFEEAIKEHNGFVGLTPGNLEESEIHWRIYSDDAIDVMPPPESKHPLTEAEKKLIDQWIKRGEIWQALVSPTVGQVRRRVCRQTSISAKWNWLIFRIWPGRSIIHLRMRQISSK